LTPRPILTVPAFCFPIGKLILARKEAQDAPHAIGFRRAADPAGDTASQSPFVTDDADGGLVTIAGTGAGKGVGQVIPALLAWPGSIVVNDPKGELYAITARHRRQMGQRVFQIDPFGSDATDALNPLDRIGGQGPDAFDNCLRLATQIVPGESHADPFWDDCARRLIAGTLLFIVTHMPRQHRTLDMLRRIWFADETLLIEALGAIAASTAQDGVVAETAALFSDAPDKTRGSMLSTLRERLTFLASRRGIRGLQGQGIDLRSYAEGEPMTIYLRLPPHLGSSHDALLRMWFGTLILAAAGRRRRPKVPDLFLVDEAAQMGRLDELLVAASLLRGYGVRTWTFWQSLGQLESLYGQRAREFLDNATSLSVFGIGNAMAATAARDLTGYDGDILGLPRDQMILARAGERPVLARRLDYRTEPDFAGRWDENPFHQSSAFSRPLIRRNQR
jgi:type IV secretion system protein VirD4